MSTTALPADSQLLVYARFSDDRVYTNQNEALHAVFLRNLEDFMRSGGAK